MMFRFPTTTLDSFRGWLNLWSKFYQKSFSLRCDLACLLELPLPPDEFCWPIVVAGRGVVNLERMLAINQPSKRGQLVVELNVKIAAAAAEGRLISCRLPGDQPYLVWVRDPARRVGYLRDLNGWQLSHNCETTTWEEEWLLNLFLQFRRRGLEAPSLIVCADSQVENVPQLNRGRKVFVTQYVAVIRAKTNLLKLDAVPPRVIGFAREVFVP